jgi:hypothetical protein
VLSGHSFDMEVFRILVDTIDVVELAIRHLVPFFRNRRRNYST